MKKINPIKQKELMEKFFTAKNYIIVLGVLCGYYLAKGMYEVTFMLVVLLFIFIKMKNKYKVQMFED